MRSHARAEPHSVQHTAAHVQLTADGRFQISAVSFPSSTQRTSPAHSGWARDLWLQRRTIRSAARYSAESDVRPPRLAHAPPNQSVRRPNRSRPGSRRVWQKTSGFRKFCRKRNVLRPWMPRRVPAHAAPRRLCPRHDKKQNRRCERLPSCPDKFFSRCKNGSKAAREQAEWLGECLAALRAVAAVASLRYHPPLCARVSQLGSGTTPKRRQVRAAACVP